MKQNNKMIDESYHEVNSKTTGQFITSILLSYFYQFNPHEELSKSIQT